MPLSSVLILLTAMLSGAQAEPIDEVAATADMTVEEVKALLDGVEKDQTVLDRMAKPWEAKPWHQYQTIFADQARLDNGVAFYKTHEAALAKASADTGVPPQIVLAILGVETRYGTVMGDDSVLRSLYTLGFHHERRGAFFRKELGHYLRLATDEGWALGEVKGSYAGAMGYGQFIPSSYRSYAADGNGDAKRDLFGSPEDAIASVANYFLSHGWTGSEHVLVPVNGEPAVLAELTTEGLKPDTTWGALKGRGLKATAPLADDDKVKLLAFETEKGPEYLVGLNDFYVITRYNHSPLYARAVYDLSVRIAAARAGSSAQEGRD